MPGTRVVLKTSEQRAIDVGLTAEQLINVFPIPREKNQQSDMTFYGTHGYTQFGSSNGIAVIRGSASNPEETVGYIVDSNTFSSIDINGNRTTLGTVTTTTGVTTIAVGDSYVAFTDGANGYTYQIGVANSFSRITDPQFPLNPTYMAYRTGYFIAVGTVANTTVFALSDVDDPTSWTTASIAEAADLPDNIVSVAINTDYYFVIGTISTEIWRLSQSGTFPLVQVTVVDIGCAATYSVVNLGTDIWLIGKTNKSKGFLVRIRGAVMEKVKNNDIDALFQGNTFSTLSDIVAYGYEEFGQQFYEFSSSSANKTYTYCIDTNILVEKKQSNGTRFVGSCYMRLNGNHIIGDYSSGKLYNMNLTTYTENGGNTIPREIDTPTYYANGDYIKPGLVSFLMDNSSFVGTETLGLQTSEDGGLTYQTALTSDPIQSTDEDVRFSRISAARRLTHKITFNANKPFVLLNMLMWYRTAGRNSQDA